MIKRIIIVSAIPLGLIIFLILIVFAKQQSLSPLKKAQGAYLSKATTLIDAGEFEKAEIELNKAEFLGRNEKTNQIEGRYYFRQKDYTKALTYLERSAVTPESKEFLGITYIKLSKYDEARNVFKSLIAKEDTEKRREYYLQSILSNGESELGLEESNIALEIYPLNALFKKYAELLNDIEGKSSETAYDYLLNANWFLENNYPKTALNLIQKSKIALPAYRDAYLVEAECYNNLGDADASIGSLKTAAEIDNYYYLTHVKLSEAYQKIGDMKRKEESLTRAKLLGYTP
ncbi:TPA: hypothetical protein DDW69_04980 [candidate division CPR2 bacterium]|uniref:Tetratricopeptide repeat protein n=1 Tax=candidate division CPR2 bacterium GW2011_GWC1_41_48 TaxID=1618344 RepID=A0A0G0W8T6_UNCC2|nr:MAG: hypothetical protein UT47_C0002G0126 [candidate division CPR2 bacterium GW2011_GWC2_39_35]KKR28682.1 MAG: hypothetical protein UT59_C0021G0003 [candidate division CPR2 bacterium GW2011_GWD1_39_7]KKS09400.1 MAG: hypothetical protein UU65_C0002G0178 [candidate division CPR2 bacterium GW2011_GWC1_41_48]OGB61342.1 MAG: hypothetical protein A2Y27_00980 [candidate division CPR2 bacterium GWD1_39_7]HBG82155.1 hypothetical protein [candidate division CPR2 bacterium]